MKKEIKYDEIIGYHDYFGKGISLHKINNLDYRSYITIDKKALLKLIADNLTAKSVEQDMDLEVLIENYYGNFNEEQMDCVLNKVRHIIKHDDKFKDYRKLKQIYLV
jgi:hypothetical protein